MRPARPERLSLQRLSSELTALSTAGLSASSFRLEAAARIRHVIPVDGYCFSSADPDSLVLTAIDAVGVDPSLARRFYENEYVDRDFAKHVQLAGSGRPVRVLHVETGEEPQRSARYRAIVHPMGFEHELRAAARDRCGTWGFLHLYRSPDRPRFDADEIEAVRRASAPLAAGLRAAVTSPSRSAACNGDAADDDGPGVILLSADDQLLRSSPSVARWLQAMDDPIRPAPLPVPEVILSVAASARRAADRGDERGPQTIVRAADDSWWMLHGEVVDPDWSTVDAGTAHLRPTASVTVDVSTARARPAGSEARAREVVIVVQPASGPQLTRIVMRGLGLSAGEREVCERLLDGRSNKQIAADLSLSPYTVQDRLKLVFAKAGVGSRQELVARLNPARSHPATVPA